MATEEKTVQTPDAGKTEAASKPWDGEFWDRGMEVFDKGAEGSAPAKKAEADENCPTCEKDRLAKEAAEKAKAKPPYKVLKVQGKEVPVESEEEFLALAQKGLDYTKKTQGVADERKELLGMKSQFQAMSERIESLVQNFGKAPQSPIPDAPKEKTAFEEYNLDPELADDWQKRMVTEAHELKKERSELRGKIDKLEEMSKMLLTKELLGMVQNTVKDTIKDFPVDDIQDENGRSLTQAQFTSLLTQKAQAEPNKPIDELAKETIMELHESQIRSKDSATEKMQGQLVTEDMSPEEFKAKYPKLFAKVSEVGLAEQQAAKDQLPPTLKSRATGVEVSPDKKEAKGAANSIEEALEAALKDPEINL
jgi:hypothetical protein